MKKYKVGLIHATINSVEPILSVFKRDYKDVETINFVDEGLLIEAKKQGKITDELLERFAGLLERAVLTGVDGILLVCSVFSPTVNEMRRRFPDIPIENVDDAMLKEAAEKGRKIGVVATIYSAGSTTLTTILDIASSQKKDVDVFVEISEEASEALSAGNYVLYDILIEDKVRSLIKDKNVDLIVLAQSSIARVKKKLSDVNIPILTSPEVSAKSIVDKIIRE